MNTPRVTLRKWQKSDAPRLAELLGNPRVLRFLSPALPRPYGLAEAQAFISFCHENHESNAPERAVSADGIVCGGIGSRIDGETAVIGYWLGEPYWRQGIMKQALVLHLQELPSLAPQVRRFTAQAYDFNPASQALLQACGFHKTDIFRLMTACDGLEHPVVTFIYGGEN